MGGEFSQYFEPRWSPVEEASWRELLAGFDSLKAITYSSGLDLILELIGMLLGVGVTFCSELVSPHEPAASSMSHIGRG
jgi:hypothetical protein